MATLERIRSKGVFLLIIIGLALLAFIIGDFLNNSSSILHKDRENVGEINGEAVKIQDFQAQIEQLTEVYKIEVGSEIDENMNYQIRESVWQSLVKSTLIKEEAEKIGIAVNDDELKEATVGNNPDPIITQRRVFANPATGQFDHDRLIGILNQLNQKPSTPEEMENYRTLSNYWNYFEKEVYNSRLERKYLTLLSKGVNANKLEAKMEFEAKKNTNDALYIYKPYSSISDDKVSVSDTEIQKKYDEVKAALKINEELRNIEFVIFANEPSAEDDKKAAEFINKLVPEFTTTTEIAEFTNLNGGKCNNVPLSANMIDPSFRDFAFAGKNGEVLGPKLYGTSYKMARIIDNTISYPDSIKIKHIVIAEKDSAATKVLADSIMNALNGGADFALLAKKYSKMQQTAQNGGDAGWVLTAQIDNDKLLSALNSHPNNVNFQFAEESSAIQIIQITDRTKAVRKAKLAIIESEVSPSKETTAKNFNLAKGFAGSSKDVAAFEANAKKNGYNVYPYTTLTSNLPSLQNLENSRAIVQWAFNDETEKGAVSDVYECGNFFVVAALKDIEPKGYRTLANEEVKDQIKYLVLRDKKAEIISKDLDGAKDINALAAKLQLSVDSANQINFATTTLPKVGFEPSVIAAIALGKQGQVSKPIKGNQGVYVVNVTKQVPATNKLDEKAEMEALTTRQLYSVYRSVDALIGNYEIVDNRKNFY